MPGLGPPYALTDFCGGSGPYGRGVDGACVRGREGRFSGIWRNVRVNKDHRCSDPTPHTSGGEPGTVVPRAACWQEAKFCAVVENPRLGISLGVRLLLGT